MNNPRAPISTRPLVASEAAHDRWTWLGLLAAMLLTIPAVLPFTRSGLPLTDDGLFHVATIIDLRQALAGGDLFPRWLEPLVEGLGFPLFNYYPSLSHYIGVGLTLLGLGEADAFKLESVLVLPLAAATMYGWSNEALIGVGVDRRTRFFAVLGAALVYAYTPYLLVDIYHRGSLAESLALALLPLFFMAVGRLRRQPGMNNALFLAPILAALVLVHNVTAALGLGLAISFLAFSCLMNMAGAKQSGSRFPMLREIILFFMLGAGLGIGLSAFYWLPAIFERSYLDFEKLSSGFFSATTHLADAWPPVQASLIFDFKDPFRPALAQFLILLPGLIPLGGLISRATAPAKPNDLKLLSAFFALSVIAVVLLVSPLALGIWGNAPIFKDMQYPWRTLGVLAFSASTLTAVGFCWLGMRWSRFFPFLAITLLAGYLTANFVQLPAVLPREGPPAPEKSLGAVSDAAQLAGWDMRSTQPSRALSAEDTAALTSLGSMVRQPGRIDFQIDVAKPATVALHALYFPTWKVFVDGRETPAFPVSERGLLGISVSGGHHAVTARFESTPLQRGAEAATVFSTLISIALLVASATRRRPATAAMVAIAILASLYIVPRFAAQPALSQDFRSLALPPVEGIRLLGIGLEQPTSASQASRQGLTLYWQALQPMPELERFVALVDEQGNTVGNPAHQPLDGAYPTSRWQVGEIIPDRIDLDLLPDAKTTGIRLNVGFRSPGQVDTTAPAITFRLPLSEANTRLSPSPPVAKLGTFSQLEDFSPSSPFVTPGDDLQLSLTWRALGTIPGGISTYFHLLDAKGKMWVQADSPLGPKAYPAILWGIGEKIREEKRLTVPAEAPPGRYDVRFGAYYYSDMREVPVGAGVDEAKVADLSLGSIYVVGPQTRPAAIGPQRTFKAMFGDQVELLGFDLGDGGLRLGQELALTTYWRSTRAVPADYTLFVQLIDSSGVVRGQSDGQFADGSYPTSLWRPGEFVVDERTIRADKGLAGGSYRLIAGLYHWPDMTKLPAVLDGPSGGKAAGDIVELAVLQSAP